MKKKLPPLKKKVNLSEKGNATEKKAGNNVATPKGQKEKKQKKIMRIDDPRRPDCTADPEKMRQASEWYTKLYSGKGPDYSAEDLERYDKMLKALGKTEKELNKMSMCRKDVGNTMSEVIATLENLMADPNNGYGNMTSTEVAIDLLEAIMVLADAGTSNEDINKDIQLFASQFKSGAYGYPQFRMVDWAKLLTDPELMQKAADNVVNALEC